jgi:hypothetical protein
MGAWGLSLFDNDDAADWGGDLDEQEDRLGFVAATFDEVDAAEDYLDAGTANTAVAAAAWLVAGLPDNPVPESTYAPESPPPEDSPAVRALAARAALVLERVVGADSEWLELWDEAGEEDPPRAVRELIAYLVSLG